MVKRQKEKQYQSSIEHKLNSQIRSGRISSGSNNHPRPLPFDCCALTLTPFTDPVCCILSNDGNDNNSNNNNNGNSKKMNHGIIFENSEIIPYLMKHRKNPVTGLDMSSQSLITLNMDFEEEDNSNTNNNKKTWQCPILNKPFMNHTKIVAIRIPPGNTANVYSYEAVHTLNIKAKNYVDLISGTKFSPKKDMIVLNDVQDLVLSQKRDLNNFVHLQMLRNDNSSSAAGSGSNASNNNINMSISAKRIMDKLQSKQQKDSDEKKKKEQREKEKKRKLEQQQEQEDNDNGNSNANGSGNGSSCGNKRDYKKMKILTSDLGITYTKGKISGSFTSTSLPSYTPSTSSSSSDIREATQEEILSSLFTLMKKRKKKAFVRMFLTNNLGHMDIELHCNIVPRTCMNFIGLIEKGWYDGTKFHRLIRNFMIQGGGANKKKNKKSDSVYANAKEKEQSLWGDPFEDEFDVRLKHTGPGILSMANAGPNTNKSQFFITFKSAPHLDNKHSIFGKVVKGLNVLRQLEDIPTDGSNNRPLEEVCIERMVLFGDNPVKDAEEIEEKKILKRMEERKRISTERKESALGNWKGNQKAVEAAAAKQSLLDSSENNSSSSVPKVGQYLQQTLKKKKKTKHNGNDKEKDDNSSALAVPSRLPPPPKKTTFGNFSGW